MKKNLWKSTSFFLVLTLLLQVSCAFSFAGDPLPLPPQEDYVPGEYIVTYETDSIANFMTMEDMKIAAEKSLEDCGASVKQELTPDMALISLRSNSPQSTQEEELFLQNIEALPEIKDIQRNYIYTASEIEDTSYQDALSSSLWGLSTIEAQKAWTIVDENVNLTPVKVAVLDTGININHEDLTGRAIYGYNTFSTTTLPTDDQGHGTHVAGIIAATCNNMVGVQGICGKAPITTVAVKVLNSEGKGNTSNLVNGISWAINQGDIKVVNMSLGDHSSFNHGDTALHRAIQSAYSAGITFVAASGNEAARTDSLHCDDVSYPAAYPEVLAVGAVGDTLQRADFSCFGPELDLCAPGTKIYSASHSNTSAYLQKSGTSMSTPYVAAAAALYQSLSPSALNTDIMHKLTSSAMDISSSGFDNDTGFGLLNLKELLREFDYLPIIKCDLVSTTYGDSNLPTNKIQFKNVGANPLTSVAFSIVAPNDTLFALSPSGVTLPLASGQLASFDLVPLCPLPIGTHHINVVVSFAAISRNFSSTLEVQPASLNVIAEDKTRFFGEENPQFTITYSGFSYNDTAQTALNGIPQINCTASSNSAVGTYPITVSGLSSTNYAISYQAGNLYVTSLGGLKSMVTAQDYTGTFDSKPHSISLILNDKISDAILEYSLDGGLTLTNINPSFTAITSASVFYKISKPGYLPLTGTALVNITAVPPPLPVPDDTGGGGGGGGASPEAPVVPTLTKPAITTGSLIVTNSTIHAFSMKPSTFTDLQETAWYYPAVCFALEHGLFAGNTATTFGPENAMTRGMLVTVLHKMQAYPTTSGINPFEDIKENAYYRNASAWAFENQIVSGTNPKQFDPNRPITRQELVVMLYHYASYCGTDVSLDTKENGLSLYRDSAEVASWAKDAFEWAIHNHILSGKTGSDSPAGSRLFPQDTATRSEVAALFMNLLNATQNKAQ